MSVPSGANDGRKRAPKSSEKFEEFTLEDVGPTETARVLPIPLRNPRYLPLSELEPEVFERLVAEYIHRRPNRSAHFYGRRGQRQHGLDIVEQDRDGRRVLYQVKRYRAASELNLSGTVAGYAGAARKPDEPSPQRRFDAARFVIVLSCPFDDDTANIDALAEVQNEYLGDLEVEVWGAEQISSHLRPAVELLTAMLGEDWARQWCGDDSVARARDAAKARARAMAAITATMNVQFIDDNNVRFRQIELTGVSVESLFVDVPATTDTGTSAEDFLRQINAPAKRGGGEESHDGPVLAGAAQVLLHPDWVGSAVVVGGPGQGKSTLLQYLCQYYRARLLGLSAYSPIAVGLQPVTKVDRTPIRIDLTDYAQWRRHQIENPPSTTQVARASATARSAHTTPAHAGRVCCTDL